MEFTVKAGDPSKQRTGCLVIGLFTPRRLSAAGEALDKATHGQLATLIKQGDIDAKCGATTLIHHLQGQVQGERILVVGCGAKKEFDSRAFLNATEAAADALNASAATDAISYLTELDIDGHSTAWKARQMVGAAQNAVYRFDELKSQAKPPKRPLRKLAVGLVDADEQNAAREGVAQGRAIAAGVALARRLGNLPGNICTPSYLAEQAREISKGSTKMKCDVLEKHDMEKLGMGALLSVARGSRQPPKLIALHYKGGGKNDQPVVLVGKGVTFDSGGISIKPGAAMDEMKFDMCGAASVLGTLSACLELKLPVNVVGLIPATENLPDGDASKPGDVVTSLSGQTIEILNTDAEGRLILCDALSYAARFKPQTVIDIATLTGACIIALGNHASGLLANDQTLADELLEAGQTAVDRAWQLPLWDEYDKQLESNFADMANIGGREAGTVTAACFLARFTKDYRWAHLDIAGTAWNSGKNKGATGRPVPLLTQFLMNRAGGGD
jgi:leucyl aminopeptidase